MSGRGRAAGPLLAAALLLASCTSGSEETPVSSSFLPSATRTDPGPDRHDPQPLTRRFTALGEPVTVTWRSGTTGDPAVPGPSTYWIDAAVQVQSPVAATLRATPGLTGAELPPDLPAAVRSAAGDGPWLTGAELDAAFSTAGFGTRAYLGAGDVLVLRAVGAGDG